MVAESDATFTRVGGRWAGKCLLCNGNVSIDERTGIGASVEHILPRARGGTNDLLNLGIAHRSCNSEKGRNWDAPRSRKHTEEEYEGYIGRLLQRRRERYRDTGLLSGEALAVSGGAPRRKKEAR